MDKIWEVRWESYKLSDKDLRGVVTYLPGHLTVQEASNVLEGVFAVLSLHVSEAFQSATGVHQPYPVKQSSGTHLRCGHSPWLTADLIDVDQAQWRQDRKATSFQSAASVKDDPIPVPGSELYPSSSQRPLTRAERFRKWVEDTSYTVTDKTSTATPQDEEAKPKQPAERKGKRKSSDL